MIGNALEAHLTVACADQGLARLLKEKRPLLPELFIVSAVGLAEAPAGAVPAVSVTVARADGKKCGRCWKYSTAVGASAAHPALCGRCVGVVESRGRG